MKQHPLAIILIMAVVALAGCCSGVKPSQSKNASQTQFRRYPNLIAHIQHDGLSFSVSLDDRDTSFLKIHISEKDSVYKSSPLPTVQLRVEMTTSRFDPVTGLALPTVQLPGDAVIEGVPKKDAPWSSNGGYAELEYRFALGRHISVDDIHSVTISINGQKYVLCPF